MAKFHGLDIYVEVNTGTEELPVWTKVGGQKGASLSLSGETIDVTDKDSAGWEETLMGNRAAEAEFDAFLIEDDAGFEAIKSAYFSRAEIDLRLTTQAKTYQANWVVTELSIEGAHDDASVTSMSLKANGAVTEADKV